MSIAYRQATTGTNFSEATQTGSLLLYAVSASVVGDEEDYTLTINAPTTSGFTWTEIDTIYYEYTEVIDLGGGGDCFSGNVKFRVPGGFVPFTQVKPDHAFVIQNETGLHGAKLIVHEAKEREMIDMGNGELVTLGHHMKLADGTYCRADQHPALKDKLRVMYSEPVYNLHVFSKSDTGHHYILENGLVAHNLEKY